MWKFYYRYVQRNFENFKKMGLGSNQIKKKIEVLKEKGVCWLNLSKSFIFYHAGTNNVGLILCVVKQLFVLRTKTIFNNDITIIKHSEEGVKINRKTLPVHVQISGALTHRLGYSTVCAQYRLRWEHFWLRFTCS